MPKRKNSSSASRKSKRARNASASGALGNVDKTRAAMAGATSGPDWVVVEDPRDFLTPTLEIDEDKVLGNQPIWSMLPRHLVDHDSNGPIPIRILVLHSFNWISNDAPTQWIAHVEWIPRKEDDVPFLACVPFIELPKDVQETFAANIHPACILEVDDYIYDSRIYPTKEYACRALQVAAVIVGNGDGELARKYLERHPHYFLREGVEFPEPGLPEGLLFDDQPIIPIPKPGAGRRIPLQVVEDHHRLLVAGQIPEELKILLDMSYQDNEDNHNEVSSHEDDRGAHSSQGDTRQFAPSTAGPAPAASLNANSHPRFSGKVPKNPMPVPALAAGSGEGLDSHGDEEVDVDQHGEMSHFRAQSVGAGSSACTAHPDGGQQGGSGVDRPALDAPQAPPGEQEGPQSMDSGDEAPKIIDGQPAPLADGDDSQPHDSVGGQAQGAV